MSGRPFLLAHRRSSALVVQSVSAEFAAMYRPPNCDGLYLYDMPQIQ
jgi:hypothetical protein